MKKIFYILASFFITLFQLFNWNNVQAQCNDATGLIAFTGYQIADAANPQGQKDRFSFVVLDSLPANTAIRFTDRGYTGGPFQSFTDARSDGELIWTATQGISPGTTIVITLDGANTLASSGSISGYQGNFDLGLAGDQLFAYVNSPFKIHAAMLINKAGWDTEMTQWEYYPILSSSKSLNPNISPRQTAIVANLQGIDQENAFQAKLNPITLTGGRNALRTQLFARTFAISDRLDVQDFNLTNSPITWNVSAPTYTALQLSNNTITGTFTDACYFQWQSSTDGINFNNIQDGAAFAGTSTAALTLNTLLTEDTWFRIRLTGAKATLTNPLKLTVPKINDHPEDSKICAGSGTGFTVGATGSGTLTYKWQVNTGSGFTDLSNGGVYSGVTASTLHIANAPISMNSYTYQVIVSSNIGVSVTSTAAKLTVNQVTIADNTTKTDVSCHGGNNGTATASATGGTQPYSYSWVLKGSILELSTEQTITGLQAGTYVVTVTDNMGCIATQEYTIGQPDALYIALPTVTPVTSYGGNDGRINITVTGGVLPYTYKWYKNGAMTAFAITEDVTGLTSGAYKVVVTDHNGCVLEGNDIVVTQPNYVPVVTGTASKVYYTEGHLGVVADGGITLTDLDNTTLSTANILIRGGLLSEDVLSFVNDNSTMGNIIASPFSGSILMLSSPGKEATLEQWNNALRSVTYHNTSNNPGTQLRELAFTVNDGISTSAEFGRELQVYSVNNPPTLTATGGTVTFTEGGSAVDLFSAVSSSTVESGQLMRQLTLTVTGVSDGAEEILAIDGSDVALTDGNSIITATNALSVTVTVNTGVAMVTVSKSSGISTLALHTLIDGVSYRNSSEAPTSINRVVSLTSIQDNGGTANGGVNTTSLSIASTVTVVAVNNAPVVTTSGGNTTFTEGASGVAIDGAVTLSDPDNTTLATARVAITGNFQAGQDVLEFANNGTTMGDITAALYNNATGVLTLSSAGSSATLAQWQAALRAVKYDNSSQNPSTAARTITFTVNDGSLGSVAATKTVSVVAVNDAPVATNDSYIINEDVTLTVPAPGILANDTDVDSNTLTAVLVTGPTNGTLTLNANGSFAYTPNANFNGTDSFTYKVYDGDLNSNVATVTITVNPVNDAPVVTVPASISVTEDVASALTAISFSDVDAGINPVIVTFSVPTGTLSATSGMGITVGGTAAMLTLSGSIANINTFIAASAVTFTTASNATNNVLLTVSINDNGNSGGTSLTDTKTTTLLVTAVNDAPVNSVPGPQSVDQDATLTFSTGNNNLISISDGDAGSSNVQVALTATNGRMTLGSTNGLIFLSGSGTSDAIMKFEGTIANINNALNGLIFTPTPGYNGSASLQIITDDKGNSGSGGAKTDTDNIVITVNSINPKVTSVGASTPNGTYKINDVIALTMTFDQTVVVNTGVGIPTLLLETGVIDREATYASGSGSNTLTFNYTVRAADISADLDYTSTTALSLNGSTIKNIHNDVAILTLPAVGSSNSIAGQRAIVIDGIVPTVTSVAVPTNGYYLLNQNLDFTIYFSEAVTVDAIGGTPRLSLTIGGQTAYANYLSGSGSPALVFRYTVAAGLEDHDGVAVGALSLNGGTIRDAAGNNAVLTLNSVGNTTGVNVDSNPPVVPANFTATGQDAQISLAWEANMETDFEKYILYVKPDGGVKTYLTDIAKGTEYYTYSGLPNGASYEFFLIAIDQRGHQSGEALASAKTMGEQSISFAALTNLTYGQQGVVLTASATSNLPVSFVSSDSNIAEVYQDNNDGGKWKVNAKKVGTVTITATQGGNNVYLPAASVPQSLTIVPAILTVTADAKTKVYGEADPALTYMVKASDLRNGDEATVVSGSLTRAQGEAVGNHDITNVDLAADNYAINYVKSQLSITKAILTVTADAKTKVYGEADPALTYAVKASDLRNGDAATVVSGTLTRAQGEAVGNYDITNVDLAASNYAINYVKSPLSITKAVLTVTADAKTKVYGDADPALTYMVKASDLRNGDAATVVSGNLTRAQGESVGNYDITNVDLAASNYAINYVKSALSITKAVLTVTADAKTKVYGTNDPALTYIATGFKRTDSKSILIGGLTRVEGENVGSYAIQRGTLAAGDNYTISYTGANLIITKATLSGLSFVNKDVVYDGAVKSIQLNGSLPTSVTVAYQNNDKINAGSYEVKAIIAETQNYFGTSFSATLLIRKAKQTISFTAPEVLGRDAGKVALDVYSSSNLPVSLIVDDPMVGTVSGTDLNVLRLGTVLITATQAGNENYEAASPVTVSVRIANDASAKLPIIVHQAVSPNGDGINEFLIIEGIRDYIDNKVTIFDKNGVVLAEIQGYDNRERVFFGNAHRDGTYYYYIDVKDGNTWKREKGFFVIKR
ncbi:gliding motility-associated C-terminal domain-containing protein [Sphingobacterium nematocida]|uniref:Gliding motility-associated C-terminal domain-containing protein n=1 Tax=Sphingobacterium nematocida TaxID=1513896 RepID=A0A1T5BN80_9SPHI|nr:MBG domain-containing protein [Sphingobacterium nematocida]SKB48751.1 gliding motility-associated C-terminal domain-containing protein [Sphingobacterium nematocida]